MTENMKKFLEAVSKDNALCARLRNATREELVAMAAETGITLTEADFEQKAELDEDELEAVAGGWTQCICAVAGGGTQDEDGKACGCVAGGYGEARNGETRCWCAFSGGGRDPDCTLTGD